LRASNSDHRAAQVLGAIFDSAVDGIIVIDANGRLEAFNPAAERLFGYRESEVIGRNVSMLMPSPYRDEHDGYIGRYLETGEARIIGVGREVHALRRDGTTFPVHLAVGEMTVDGERKFTGIVHDLSARVRMEEQLREQAALVRLGEMAAVIAHEIKNPLAGIRGAVQVIGSRLASGSREASVTDEIVARIDALNALIRDLLLFARPPQPRPALVEVLSVVATTIDLLRDDPTVAGVDIELEGTSPPVLADPELLKIVFQNLLINSAEAMHGRGRIRIVAGTTGAGCEVRFLDSGPGIPAEIRDKVFAPFFTTKARGTGLGLATARRLIEAHRGFIRIDVPPGGGTAITVHLPLAGAGTAV